MAQLTFSSKHFNTTKMTPFYANFERESNLLNFRQSEVLADATEKQIKILRIVHDNIMRMQQHFFKYVNRKRKIASLLKKKDKVYLLTKNLKTKRSSQKLNHVKIDSFFIKKVKRPKTYELNLLKEIRVFPIFDISLLKSPDFSTFIQKTFHFESNKEEIYAVEKNPRKKRSEISYQMKRILTFRQYMKIIWEFDELPEIFSEISLKRENPRKKSLKAVGEERMKEELKIIESSKVECFRALRFICVQLENVLRFNIIHLLQFL